MDEAALIRQLRETPELLTELQQTQRGDELAVQSRLRARFPAELVVAALQLSEIRRRAAQKFTHAPLMWLDRTGYEQSTAEAVAQHKARRFAGAGSEVIDLCCGIGADSIALAQQGLRVRAVDRSEAACLRTTLNAQVHAVEDRVQTVRAQAEELDLSGMLVHFDPDRRSGPRRARKLEEYEPGLEFMHRLIAQARGGAIKLSPASNFGGEFPGCEVELISLHRECREAVVWFGCLAGSQPRRATVLPSGESLFGHPADFRPEVRPIGKFLYDPDPAVVRSGLIDQLTSQSPLARLDDAEEYLTSDELVSTPLAAAFEVQANLPHNQTQIRNHFREHPAGDLEIKSRHIPTDEVAMRKKIPLEGTGRATLIIARLQGKTRAIAARRLERNGP